MAELTFRSPGVSTREIDLSGPSPTGPQGTPAGVIGTADRGPGFVPVTFASYADFANTFGATDGEKFGPLAIQQWLQNRQAGTYLRVLGAGDGKTRLAAGTNAGKVTRAGFAVGDKIVQANGAIASNANAGGDLSGRTYFLGAFMNEAASSTIFSDAFADANALLDGIPAMPVIRATLFAPNGIQLAMSSAISWKAASTSNPSAVATADLQASRGAATSQGQSVGSINLQTQEFVLLLNGLKQTGDQGKNVITASFDPQSTNYVSKVFNTDPLAIEKQGHLLYNHYPIYNAYAVVTGAGIVTQSYTSPVSNVEQAVWIVTGTQGQNVGTSTQPNYEGFEDRFTTAFSPFVISQKFGGTPDNLFRVHCLDDGEYPNTKFKLSVENIQKSNNPAVKYGKFDLVVRRFSDDDRNVQVLEAFRGLSIDPGSDRYIARVIGDMRTYFDFDQRPGSQKLVVDGKFPNASRYIRVEMATPVDNGTIDKEALPVGFRGPHHLVTSGTTSGGLELLSYTGSFISGSNDNAFEGGAVVPRANWANKVVEPPIPFRRTVSVGTGISQRVDGQLYWGAQFEALDSLTEPNKNNAPVPSMSPISAHVKPFAGYHTTARNPWAGNNAGTADDGGIILDSDVFNNNRFTLENVQVATTTSDVVDSKEWQGASYRRNASLITGGVTKNDNTTTTGRFLDISKDFGDLASKKFYKFSFFVQGGFNGVNIFNEDKAKLLDPAVKFEIDDSSNQGGTDGPTIAAYRKAIDILKEKSDAEIQLLAIPGLRQTQVTDYATEAIEDRFDAVYLMDIKQFDSSNVEVTGSSSGQPNVTYTVNNFKGRGIDSSFAAAYFPDVIVTDPTTNTNVQVPPSVAVLGAFGLNDSVAQPWFAPAGFARGALAATDVQVKTNRANLDNLYDARINPITSFPGTGGPTIFGQKTLQAAESALDRINVRRLLIEIRRQVRQIANNFIFEPNREATLARFSGAVNPLLTRIQQQQGLDRFKVQIDTTTTTQADIENNTVRGKIFLQPTRSVEFISLDFVVSNAGAEI